MIDAEVASIAVFDLASFIRGSLIVDVVAKKHYFAT